MLDVKPKFDHCNHFFNSTRIVSFSLQTEGMSSNRLTYVQYLNYALCVIAEMPNYELTGNHTLSLPPLYL